MMEKKFGDLELDSIMTALEEEILKPKMKIPKEIEKKLMDYGGTECLDDYEKDFNSDWIRKLIETGEEKNSKENMHKFLLPYFISSSFSSYKEYNEFKDYLGKHMLKEKEREKNDRRKK